MKYLVGIGNYTMHDDSIGLRVVEHIENNKLDRGFVALDLSSNLLNLFSYLNESTEKIIIIDCINDKDSSPGSFGFYKKDQLRSKKVLMNLSGHEGDIIRVLELAQSTGYYIPKIEIMGIVPFKVELSFGISKELEQKIDFYATEAIKKLHS